MDKQVCQQDEIGIWWQNWCNRLQDLQNRCGHAPNLSLILGRCLLLLYGQDLSGQTLQSICSTNLEIARQTYVQTPDSKRHELLQNWQIQNEQLLLDIWTTLTEMNGSADSDSDTIKRVAHLRAALQILQNIKTISVE